MGQQPEPTADESVYAHLEVPPSDEERRAARERFRRVLAEKRANEVPGLREQLRRRFRSDAA
jgi:hypothetical protein